MCTTSWRSSNAAQTLAPASDVTWRGHAYLAAGAGVRPLVDDGMLLVGDAAGLAYTESGEGIGPAIESGRLAAETLMALDGKYRAADLQPYARALMHRHPRVRPTPTPLRGAVVTAGRVLMRWALFTRHVVLDRWFLRATPAKRDMRAGSQDPAYTTR